MPRLSPSSTVIAVAATDATGATAQALEASTSRVTIRNLGPNTVYVATQTGVLSTDGFPIPSGVAHSFGKEPAVALDLYFVCAGGETADVRIMPEH